MKAIFKTHLTKQKNILQNVQEDEIKCKMSHIQVTSTLSQLVCEEVIKFWNIVKHSKTKHGYTSWFCNSWIILSADLLACS